MICREHKATKFQSEATLLEPFAVAAASAAAMLYVGLYQSRLVGRLICPIFGYGCEEMVALSTPGAKFALTANQRRSLCL